MLDQLVLLLEAEPDVIDDDGQGVVKTVDDVVPGQTVPDPHYHEVDQVGHLRQAVPVLDQALLHCEEGEAHEDEVSEPGGQSHVPAVPEFLDVVGRERLVEVHRRVDAHKVGNRHGEEGVAREVKEQVH